MAERANRNRCFAVIGILVLLFALVAVVTVTALVAVFRRMERDKLQEIGNEAVVSILAATHWSTLETNAEFKVVISDLIGEFRCLDYQWKAIRPDVNSPSPEQKPDDDVEAELLKQWATNPGAENPFQIRETADGVMYYKPIFVTSASCITCHRATNPNNRLGEGDLQAIIRVRLRTE